MTRRTTLYLDMPLHAALVRLAGPFGEPGKVVAVAIREARVMAPEGDGGPYAEQVKISLAPATKLRLVGMAHECGDSWQGVARRLIAQWVADYDARTGLVKRAG